MKSHVATSGARVLSVGAYRPARVVGNEEICPLIDSTPEWIMRRSGIESRRFAGAGENVVTMAEQAAKVALDRAGLAASRVDTVLVATMSHLEQSPAAAPQVAERLGNRAAAFDVHSACAGFCVALGTAEALVRSGVSEYVLVIGSDKMTDVIDPRDRSTAFLFADGAGAVVIGPGEAGISPVAWSSDGSGRDLIAHSAPWSALRDDPAATWPTMRMAGQPVFRWATREVPNTVRAALKLAGVGVDELAAFIPHQSNIRITDALARSLELGEGVAIAQDVRTAGNTSAASIPLAMDRMLADGEAAPGDLALLVGFGGGLSLAAQVVELP